MRWPLPALFLAFAAGCGGPSDPPPEPIEVPEVVEAPTPPPLASGDDLSALLPVEPPLPPGAKPPERTPAPEPEPLATKVPAGAKPLTFDRVVLASGVDDRQPTGAGTTFRDGTEVYCFMSVTNPGPKRALRHVWYFGDQKKSSVGVKVGGPTWRTWTSRPVYGVGSWRVDVVDEEGAVLESVAFEVE